MPGVIHEFLIEVVRRNPNIAVGFALRSVSLPQYDDVTVADSNLSHVAPPQYFADVVLRLWHKGVVVASFVVEVQLRSDDRKEHTWKAYWGVE